MREKILYQHLNGGKSKFATIADTFFILLICFFVIFAWGLSQTNRLGLSFALACSFAFPFMILFIRFQRSRRIRLRKKIMLTARCNCFLHDLALGDTETQLCILQKILSYQPQIKFVLRYQDYLVYWLNKKRNVFFFIPIAPNTSVSPNELLQAYRTAKSKNEGHIMLCCCGNFADEAISFAKQYMGSTVTLVSGEQLATLAHKAHMLPNQNKAMSFLLSQPIHKQHIPTKLFQFALHPSRIKNYVLWGILLFTLSFFTFYPTIYQVAAILSLSLAFFIRQRHHFQSKKMV